MKSSLLAFCDLLLGSSGPNAPSKFAADTKLPGHEQREHDRYRVNWPASCTMNADQYWHATIVDASRGGLGLDRDLPVETGQILTIALPQIGTYSCQIAWKGKGRCGVKFLDEDSLADVSLNELAAFLDRNPSASETS